MEPAESGTAGTQAALPGLAEFLATGNGSPAPLFPSLEQAGLPWPATPCCAALGKVPSVSDLSVKHPIPNPPSPLAGHQGVTRQEQIDKAAHEWGEGASAGVRNLCCM